MSKHDIIIDDEFKKLIPPLTTEELENLHLSLDVDGCRDKLIVWKEEGILLDGHNRYDYCTANDIPFEVDHVSTGDRETAKRWMLLNQLSRRNLSPMDATRLTGKLYNSTKGDKEQNLKQNASKYNNYTSVNAAEEIAKKVGVTPLTVKNAGKLDDAIQELGIEDAIADGTEKRTRKAIVEAAEAKREEQGTAKKKRVNVPREWDFEKEEAKVAKYLAKQFAKVPADDKEDFRKTITTIMKEI